MGPTRMLRFIGTELQNLKRFLKKCGQWAHGVPQLGGPHLLSSRTSTSGRRVWTHWTLAAPLLSRGPLGVCGSLWVQRALQRRAGGDGRVGAGQEQSQRGRRKRHFSLGWCSWSRPWPRGGVAAWLWLRLQLRRWAVTEDPGGGGQVGTWQYFQGRAGAPCGLRARLGHQDGLLPNFQDVC